MKNATTSDKDHLAVFFLLWKKYGQIFMTQQALKKRSFGRPPIQPRKIFRAILFILWTGGSWRSLPASLGKRSTVHGYFLKWAQSGLFKTLWESVTEDAAQEKSLTLGVQVIDATHVLTVDTDKQVSGFSYKYKNKRAVKISLLVDSKGIPISLSLDAANVHDAKLLDKTLAESTSEAVDPKKKALLADSAYLGEDQKNSAQDYGFMSNFRPRKNANVSYAKKQLKQNKKNRWIVERSISWIKNMRRIRFCYERSLETFKAFCQLTCAYIAFKRCLM